MENILKEMRRSLNLRIVRKEKLVRLKAELAAKSQSARDLRFIKNIAPEFRAPFLDYLDLSQSQIRQDLFVLSELCFKKNGYFVEFGATDGVGLSNTYLLESEFGWDGILAEPARAWHKALRENRKANIETRCVWKQSGEKIIFNEAEILEFSTVNDFSASDFHNKKRRNGHRYEVETISLNDLLEKYQAPSLIDYLSIDTEGSEYDILKEHDFSRHKFRIITCEHNYTPMRDKIYELLMAKGYVRKFEDISEVDDWYVLRQMESA